LTHAVTQLAELLGDDGDRTSIEVDDGRHGHKRIRQMA